MNDLIVRYVNVDGLRTLREISQPAVPQNGEVVYLNHARYVVVGPRKWYVLDTEAGETLSVVVMLLQVPKIVGT